MDTELAQDTEGSYMPVNNCKTNVVVIYEKDPEVGKKRNQNDFWAEIGYSLIYKSIISMLDTRWIHPINVRFN